jgi:hypothetical protein
VESHLGWATGEVGLISVTEDNVINNRPLSAGLITGPRKLLIIPVADDVGITREVEAIVNLMPKTRHLTTVAIAGMANTDVGSDDKIWRVQSLIEIEGIGVADEVLSHFPLVEKIRREELVPIKGKVASHKGPWLLPCGTIAVSTANVYLPPSDGNLREVTPGDEVILCDATLNIAVAAGIVKSIELAGNDLRVIVNRVTVFAAPVRVEEVA